MNIKMLVCGVIVTLSLFAVLPAMEHHHADHDGAIVDGTIKIKSDSLLKKNLTGSYEAIKAYKNMPLDMQINFILSNFINPILTKHKICLATGEQHRFLNWLYQFISTLHQQNQDSFFNRLLATYYLVHAHPKETTISLEAIKKIIVAAFIIAEKQVSDYKQETLTWLKQASFIDLSDDDLEKIFDLQDALANSKETQTIITQQCIDNHTKLQQMLTPYKQILIEMRNIQLEILDRVDWQTLPPLNKLNQFTQHLLAEYEVQLALHQLQQSFEPIDDWSDELKMFSQQVHKLS